MKLATKICIAALMSTVDAGSSDMPYDYLLNGADWPYYKEKWYCHLTNQSPIDLRTDMHSDPFPKENGRDFTYSYKNVKGATIYNKGLVVQMDFPDANADGKSPNNYFESTYASEKLGSDQKFSAAQFHFHAKSEHTINGRRFDMEMHTVHLADGAGTQKKKSSEEGDRRRLAEETKKEDEKAPDIKIFASATGFIFDRYNYDPTVTGEERLVIDRFFDSMNFEKTPPTVNSEHVDYKKNYKFAEGVDVPYADLVGIMNVANRWVYTGSLTTPPCNVGVLFNIFDRVLPISEKHFNAYIAHQQKFVQKNLMSPKGENVIAGTQTNEYGKKVAKKTLDTTGNWRITNKVDFHGVKYMRYDYQEEEKSDPMDTTIVLAVLLGVSVFIAVILGICACWQMKGSAPSNQLAEEEAVAEGGQSVEVNLNDMDKNEN